jgi:5-methylcytosine-specific restriction endonuclease McrA
MKREKVSATKRGRMTIKRREEVWLRYNKCCAHCLSKIPMESPTTIDHILPLELGGQDFLDNLQPLCPPCDKSKFRSDIERIAKMRRQEQMEKPRPSSRMKGRGFDKSRSRKFDGTIVNRPAGRGAQSD